MKFAEPASDSMAGFLLLRITLARRKTGSVDTVDALKDRDARNLPVCADGAWGERFD
ncbi:MAG: hypothetical protein AAFO68_03925 [Pseudomonadota bacterium]